MNRIPDGGYLIWGFIVCLCFTFLWSESGAAQAFFEDVTEEAIGGPSFRARSAAFGDYDNDGWPDMFLSEGSLLGEYRIALLRNEAEARFADRTDAIQAGGILLC